MPRCAREILLAQLRGRHRWLAPMGHGGCAAQAPLRADRVVSVVLALQQMGQLQTVSNGPDSVRARVRYASAPSSLGWCCLVAPFLAVLVAPESALETGPGTLTPREALVPWQLLRGGGIAGFVVLPTSL